MRHRIPIPTGAFHEFVGIVRRLRRDCPWDREQTHRSLRQGLIEETYEVVEAINGGSSNDLRSELGDILLHVVLHSTIAEEKREFTLKELLEGTSAKLVRRHPHVFGSRRVRGAEEVRQNWEKIKMAEGRTSLLEGVPRSMPALQRALRVQERASRVGFDWSRENDVWAKVREELEELRAMLRGGGPRQREEEFGDLLFSLVNYARFINVNPEHALHATTAKFTRRFQHIERELTRRGKDIHSSSLKEMDSIWNQAKRPRRRRDGRMKSAPGRKKGSKR
jgi:tetrapyrrole methylase family protein/MazG family protein